MQQDPDLSETALQAVEGVMQILQVLVVCLSKSGQLDTAEFARLLTDFRHALVAPDSVEAVLIDRMLGMLVDEPEVLLRRSAFRLIPGGGPAPGPSPQLHPPEP